MKKEELRGILEAEDDGPALSRFLKENPYVFRESLQFQGKPGRVMSDFPIGSDLRADFVVLAPYSSAFEIKLIKLGSPGSRFFAGDGSLSPEAEGALEQMKRWRSFIAGNQKQFLRDIERQAQKSGEVRYQSEQMTCAAGWPIHHPIMRLRFSYDIIMGRGEPPAGALPENAALREMENLSLIPWDQLLLGTGKMDLHPEG
ncbi:Shedu anti-phage system protein SduA domain-containing protein [Luteolibacter sp. AS25]|uniref:Shedu anti-phage system protein SduA domain-containing protein n=1 Tax=Luteolibacter sp. AS25 TaxID=3135776 RepID=UPI00398B332A